MTRIQSSTGLITGIPIQDTVDKLITVASQPKVNLTNRTQDLQNEKLAVQQLSSLLVAFQFESKQLGSEDLFKAQQVTSSNTAALTAASSTTGTPAAGNYLFTPVQTASAQQLLSQSFGTGDAIGAGSFAFGVGGFVDKGIGLDQLNGGDGVPRGNFRITDRSGQTAVIDLSYARTVDDVLDAINGNTSINVTAVTDGDKLTLIDNTGGSGNLKVQEVAGGKTASGLGLAGIDTNSASATGSDIFTLFAGTSLSQLNDGNGVQLRAGNDLSITLADGSTVGIDLGNAKTLKDVLTAINAASPTKVSAEIGSDGNRLKLTDLTSGAGTISVANVGSGAAADDLGLTTAASANTITGSRLVSGLRDTLVSSLKGGQGLGTLGQVNITNRHNITSNVDLSGAETIGDIVNAINDQAAGVKAAVNSAHNGIVLTDTTGETASNFIVADGDANSTATALGIVSNSSSTKVNSGPLNRQQVSRATLLSSLKGGTGIDVGDFKITDSKGVLGAVDLNKVGDVATTVGDVIDRINSLSGVGVQARINDRGDGIELIDTAGGTGKLSTSEVGHGTTAADLRLLGTAKTVTIEGTPTQVIDGTATATVDIDSNDTLSDVVAKINALNRGVTASVLTDGNRQRLSLTADQSGAGNELLLDTSDTALSFQEISSGRDALVQYGSSGSGGILISSPTNQFKSIVSGLDVTVNDGTLKPVTVNVAASSTSLVSNAKEFVAAYNSMRTTLDKLTDYDADTQTTGILFGTTAALRVEDDLSHVITSAFFGVGKFQSLAAVGITLDDKGQMNLDEAKLTDAFNKDPAALKTMFTDKKLGVSAKLDTVVEQLAGAKNSVLASRTDSLTDIIDNNKKRITEMSDALDRQRELLMAQFDTLETTVANLQQNLSALSSLQVIAPLTLSGSTK
jgi:flagellar hook-associated protein 2